MGIDARILVRTRAQITDAQVAGWAYRLGEAFGHDQFWLWPAGHLGIKDAQRAIERVAVYEQDGPDIVPEDGETLLEIHVATRYYGPDYERGDLPFLYAVAMWVEANIPGASVWYGGDSSGVLAAPFGAAERATLMAHFAMHGHNPYRSYFDREKDGPVCEFCGHQMLRYGWGGDYAGWACQGCGSAWERREGVMKQTMLVGGQKAS